MPNQSIPEPENDQSFDEILSDYEQSHSRKAEGGKQIEGTIVAITPESAILDIGYKSEGILPLSELQGANETLKPGTRITVTVKGRGAEGYYELSLFKAERPTDWAALERAYNEHEPVVGTVMAVVKGGLSVDVGVRAFMPASRSGARDAAEMEKLVEQEIRCFITKLDVTNEDVVVDRRAVAEEEERTAKERRYSELNEGDTVRGVVRSLTDYGAFVDLGGVDGLLHVAEMSWSRVKNPADVLSVGQEVDARILKIDREKGRISLGLKQLQPYPWDSAAEKYKIGDRVRGTVTRLTDFGAFVELEPGIEGLIHISEMSWARRIKKASDVVSPGETVDAVILAVNVEERRISLGLKQALGDPWEDVTRKFPVGSVVEGPVTSLTKFGAFVQLTEGIEGMVHVSDISAEKRINHPQDVLKVGQSLKAQVLEIDTERRRLKLGMKQLLPTSLEEYIAEHKEGETVTGRVVEIEGGSATVELGEGIQAECRVQVETLAPQENKPEAKAADLSSLTSMLQARWKGTSGASSPAKPEPVRSGQIRSFRIRKLDAGAKKIEVDLV